MKNYALGLVGYPLTHSLSHFIHLAALKSTGLSGQYSRFEIQPGTGCESDLADLLEKLKTGSLIGLNVTIPYKQRIMKFLDKLTVTAAAAGAVNTILYQDGELVGENTDVAGFLADLQRYLPDVDAEKNAALILGCGGAARAVALALLTNNWKIIVAGRNRYQREALASDLLDRFQHTGTINVKPIALPFGADLLRAHSLSLVINATSAGMTPQESMNPWPAGVSWPPEVLVYDLVYNPPETLFLKSARVAGLQSVSGLGMLVEQAALSFELWTGLSPQRSILYDEAHKQLSLLAGA